MKLNNATSLFNMGDTSIRVKQVIDVNKLILKKLDSFMKQGNTWERNNYGQEEFYNSFIDEVVKLEKEEGIELFRDFSRKEKYDKHQTSRLGMRGRTLTNALVKIGFINSKRELSEVGNNYMNSQITPPDHIEKLLGLYYDSLVYFRQFLKLRIYDWNSDSFYYNYRFAIKFLSIYDDVPQNNFLKIIESIRPTSSEEELNRIIDDYKLVENEIVTFDKYYTNIFAKTFVEADTLEKVKQMFKNREYTDENFISFFYNRDSVNVSLLYKKFVMAIINLQEGNEKDKLNSFEIIKELSKDTKIKKAFGRGKIPFNINRRDSITDFFNKNKDNMLLTSDHFDKYMEFLFSKQDDLIREYSDMGRRAFQISGIMNFNNNLVNLNNKWLIKPLLDIIGENFILSGNESYSKYEEENASNWFKDISLIDIFSITERQIINLFNIIGKKFKENDIEKIRDLIDIKQENEFKRVIEEKFPLDKVIQVLKYISERKYNIKSDEKVFSLVTDNATIPTIYEYILTIAWYYISNKKINLSKTFQLSLDGNKLPLTHRGGGAGDIEVLHDDYSLLIEATLMDINAQKRGELEPVIRHSVNFAINNSPRNTQTIFIANELDNNVINIFRSMQFVEQNGTFDSSKSVNGLNIFAFTTFEIIELLRKNISDIEIIEKINNSLDMTPVRIKNKWRDDIITDILN